MQVSGRHGSSEINDPATPTERPPYWGKCEEMGLAQLGRFIEHALNRLGGPASLDPEDLPTLQEEFVALCDLMSAKANALKQSAPTPLPPRPKYDGPRSPEFTPSAELEELYRRRDVRLGRLEDAIRYREPKSYVAQVRRDLRAVERQIPLLEEAEKERRREHEKRRREYDEAWIAYKRCVRAWEAQEAQERKRLEAEAKRDRLVERTRRKVKRAFDPQHATDPLRGFGPERISTLPFEIAAPGERTDARAIYRYYREVMGRRELDGFDQDRLDKVLTLPWNNWAKGRADSDGYIVLMFDHTEKALLECPVYGNALFVLDSSEEHLLKMNKQELIASDEVKRIFHSGTDWFRRVKQALDVR